MKGLEVKHPTMNTKFNTYHLGDELVDLPVGIFCLVFLATAEREASFWELKVVESSSALRRTGWKEGT